MGGCIINFAMTGGDDIDGLLDDGATDLEVVHEDGACGPCLGNNDPSLVPFPGCRGNSALWISNALGDDPDGDGDDKDKVPKDVGNMCQCKVRLVHEETEIAY